MTRFISGLAVGALALLLVFGPGLAGDARAMTYGTVDLNFQTAYGAAVTVYEGANVHNTQAGPYGFTLKNSYGDQSGLDAFGLGVNGQSSKKYGFCIDLVTNISYTNYTGFKLMDLADTVNVGTQIPGMTTQKVQYVERLWANYLTAKGSVPGPLGSTYDNALSIAIWEVMNDTSGTFNVKDGNIYVNWDSGFAAVGQANSWLASVKNANSNEANVYALYKYGVQGQSIVLSAFSAPPPVPEPGTMVGLIGLALCGGFGLIRNGRQK